MEMVILSAELETNTTEQNKIATGILKRYLKDNDKSILNLEGCYKGVKEKSFAVNKITLDIQFFKDIAKVFNQDSILVLDKDNNGVLHYFNGVTESIGALKAISRVEALTLDAYSRIGKMYFTFK